MNVTQTILAQLGGNRFIAMTGAKNFVSSETGLSFQLPAHFAKKKIIGVRITLQPDDLYRVEFFAKAKRDPILKVSVGVDLVEAYDGIYADTLRWLFTDVTGLETRL